MKLYFSILISICTVETLAQNLDAPLYLTSFIQSGQFELAQQFARVRPLTEDFEQFPSYSGFITVNSSLDSHVFFWYFPAQTSTPGLQPPLILWLEGGPGVSALYPLFNGNGPYRIDSSFRLQPRNFSLNLDKSIIYVDNPVGTGFSFTKDEAGYLKSALDPTHTYNFLQQFFKMFPDLQASDFYVGGHSFGGMFAPAIAHEIHSRNQGGSPLQVNLKGLILEAPFSTPLTQMGYGNYMYSLGFLDDFDRIYVEEEFEKMLEYIHCGRFDEGYEIWQSVLPGENSYVLNKTGQPREFLENYLGSEFIREDGGLEFYFAFYVEQEYVRNAIHVGNLTYLAFNPLVTHYFEDKGLTPSSPLIGQLLQESSINVIVYTGQLDILTYHLGIKKMVNELAWDGAEEFKSARATPFKSRFASTPDEVNGFVTQARNLTYVYLRSAGHDVTADKRRIVYDVIDRFIRNVAFSDFY